MAKPPVIELQVLRSEPITPHMRRITLGGKALESFPADQESAYLKLIFPRQGRDPLMRTYTIRAQRPGEMDIDFALHDHGGPASTWAEKARPGDRINVAGPGAKKRINPQADWFFLAGDMTALPAISVNLKELPENAKGYAVIEVISEEDIQSLPHPQGIELHWQVNPTPDPSGQSLLNRVKALPWLSGEAAVWAACEFSSMRALRQYFKQERKVAKTHLYISSYWKIGATEDGHKLAKRQDSLQNEEGL